MKLSRDIKAISCGYELFQRYTRTFYVKQRLWECTSSLVYDGENLLGRKDGKRKLPSWIWAGYTAALVQKQTHRGSMRPDCGAFLIP